ncbi:cobaltochelatase subunit CobN, partial [bacterium]|nr:cobaltochelatase subunit CobN [bacterium]
TQAVVQNQDNREHDILDSDDYYQFEGGMAASIEHLSGKVIGQLVREVSQAFMLNEKKIMDGQFDLALASIIPSASYFHEMFSYAYKHIYSCTDVVRLKLAGYEVIQGLLDIFVPSVYFSGDPNHFEFSRNSLLVKLLPDQFECNSQSGGLPLYERLHRITDFISGMTDSYAVKLYNELKGTNL